MADDGRRRRRDRRAAPAAPADRRARPADRRAAQRAGRRSRARPGGPRPPPGRTAIRDAEREREVLLRVSMANEGPLPQADLLALYRRLFVGDAGARDAGPRAGAGTGRDRERATSRPDLRGLPRGGLTRFAPAPTGYLHLGHVANAVWVWGVARDRWAPGAAADRGPRPASGRGPSTTPRCSRTWRGWGSRPIAGPSASPTPTPAVPATRARRALRADGLVYGCDCTRSTFAAWAPRPAGLVRAGLSRAAVATAASTGPCCASPSATGRRRGWTPRSGRAPTTSRRRGDLADPRPARQLDLRLLRRRRRPAPGRRPRRPRPGPARRDAGPDPARPAARSRGAADVPPPPADPPARRPRSSRSRRAIPGSASCARPAESPRRSSSRRVARATRLGSPMPLVAAASEPVRAGGSPERALHRANDGESRDRQRGPARRRLR